MADLQSTLATYECDCGNLFIEEFASYEYIKYRVECPACETPGVNE
ncbi:hypothetical protein ACN20G_23600 [Streptomyces sp. BI20]